MQDHRISGTEKMQDMELKEHIARHENLGSDQFARHKTARRENI